MIDPRSHPPSVLAIVPDRTACSMWRIFQPFAALKAAGYPAGWAFRDHPRVYEVVPYFDAYVLPRLCWTPETRARGQGFIERIHNAGKIAIYEVDDDLFSPWVVPQQHAAVAKDRSLEQLELDRLDNIFALQLCDGVTVSSRRLATVVREYTDKPVEVVPNALDLTWWRAVQRNGERMIPTLTVGWAGGARPDRDVAVMAEAWGQIVQRFRDVTFIVQGFQPAVIDEFVPSYRLRRIPWLELEAYPLGMMNIDIGCAPLADAPFNRCKTGIKVMEYAASGAAVVASPTVYGSVIRHGENGYLANTAHEWEEAIGRLLEDAFHRAEIGGRLRTEVTERYSLEQNKWNWPTAWMSIVEHSRTRAAPLQLVS